MNGYIEIEVTANGETFTCFQKIVDGEVIDYVNASGQSVTLPEPCENRVVSGDLLPSLS